MVTLDEMFQLLTELDAGTSVVLHTSPDQAWGYIGWFRGSDGSVIDYPERDLIGTLQSLGLLTTEDVVLKKAIIPLTQQLRAGRAGASG